MTPGPGGNASKSQCKRAGGGKCFACHTGGAAASSSGGASGNPRLPEDGKTFVPEDGETPYVPTSPVIIHNNYLNALDDDAFGVNAVHEVPTVIPSVLNETHVLEKVAHDDTARFLVIDTACQRSVVGTSWILRCSHRVKSQLDHTIHIQVDDERFKFGDDALRKSDGRACVPLGLNCFVIFLYMNLLPFNVLPLASRVFLEILGAVIDIPSASVDFTRIKVQCRLVLANNNHLSVAIDEFPEEGVDEQEIMNASKKDR